MLKSNLISLLKTFSPQEFREFGEFVESPFFNKNKKVTELFDVIKKSYPKLDSGNLEKEKVFKKIFPGEKFRDNTLRLLMFYLYENAKQFIEVNALKNDKLSSNIFLVRDLIGRNLIKEAEKSLKDNYEELEGIKLKNEIYFWNKYLSDEEMISIQERQFAGRYEKYMTGTLLEDLHKNLTDHYLLRTLRRYTVVLNTNEIYKTNFDLQSYRDIINIFDSEYYKDAPLIEMYYYASKMLELPDEENNFYKLREIVLKEEANIDRNSLLDLYINLENYCVRKGRLGLRKFDRELFEIYKVEIDKKLYKQDRFMPHLFYKSVLTTALMIKEFEWAVNFMEQFKSEMITEYRDSVYYHCYARFEMARSNFEKALEYLSKVKIDEIYLKTETKLMLAVIFYEMGIDDSLGSLLDTLRHFFKNDQFMAEDRKNFYWDFVRILNKVNSIKNKPETNGLFEIKQLISSKEKIFHKQWLLEKTEAMLRGLKSPKKTA